MADPLGELNARVAELRANLGFVALAATLRPRIGEAIQWQAGGEVLRLVQEFMNAKSMRTEGVYGGLFVALMASFERYLRMLIVHSVETQAAAAETYDDLPDELAARNLVLTGRVLANIDAPREYVTVNIEALISNLASCKKGAGTFRLNAQAFSMTVTGAGPTVVEDALRTVGVKEWWDDVGENKTLAGLLGTKGPRQTGLRARDRLRELCRWRNHLAHGGDEEISLSEARLRDAIDFVQSFAEALFGTVQKRLQRRAGSA